MSNRFANWKRPHPYLVLVIVMVVGVMIIRYGDAVAIRKATQLESEFVRIEPQPGTRILEQETRHKVGSAYVQRLYSAPGSFEDVVKYYSLVLRQNGWTFQNRKVLPSKIEQIEFCKGTFAADLWREAGSDTTVTFWLNLNWRLSTCGHE